MMKRAFVVAAVLLAGCAEGEDGPGDSELRLEESDIIVENLVQAGFPEDEIEVRDDGRVVVGGDAVVTLQASRELAGITSDGDGYGDDETFRQYRTTNIVNTAQVTTICINPSAAFEGNALMLEALDAAIGAYNAENLQFTMARDGAGCTAGANGTLSGTTWTMAGNLDNSGGGVSGFPSGGMPYHEFFVGQSLASNYGVGVAAHVIMHELGHCVGFRHSDYYNRSISCGGGPTNEGASDVGAVHIAGTPQTAVMNGSVMNSCYNLGSTPQWTASDVTALDCLYDTGSCAPPPPPTYNVNVATVNNLSGGSKSTTQFGPYNATPYSAIRIAISGGSGDADLYVRYGSAPTTKAFDCRPFLAGSNEACEFNPSQDGNYYVMVRGYSAYNGLTLSVTAAN